MIVVLSNSKLIGSRLISFFTKDGGKASNTPSHVSILFYGRVILEAVFSCGVRFNYFPYFKKINKVIAGFKYIGNKYEDKKEYEIYGELANKYYGQDYDFIGVIWFGIQILKKYLFNRPIKKVNKWESQRRQFCVEMLEDILGSDLSMLDPKSTLRLLRDHPDFIEIKASEL